MHEVDQTASGDIRDMLSYGGADMHVLVWLARSISHLGVPLAHLGALYRPITGSRTADNLLS